MTRSNLKNFLSPQSLTLVKDSNSHFLTLLSNLAAKLELRGSPSGSKDLDQRVGHQEADVDPAEVGLAEVELGLEHDLEEGDRLSEEVAEAVGQPRQDEGQHLAST